MSNGDDATMASPASPPPRGSGGSGVTIPKWGVVLAGVVAVLLIGGVAVAVMGGGGDDNEIVLDETTTTTTSTTAPFAPPPNQGGGGSGGGGGGQGGGGGTQNATTTTSSTTPPNSAPEILALDGPGTVDCSGTPNGSQFTNLSFQIRGATRWTLTGPGYNRSEDTNSVATLNFNPQVYVRCFAPPNDKSTFTLVVSGPNGPNAQATETITVTFDDS